MKLRDLVPNLTPEQLANCDVKIAVNWTERKAKLAIVDENNDLIAARELKTSSAPNVATQEQYWKLHHNPWLD